ncbi:hypothetical protein GCM10009785_19900 [Brooklawnia cerclae]|uniref:Uncharacterized protein n=1 Tax=Brooklawnia cerclae TaxID=349934 RepID=A0ABX0SFV8_9ACTN|nr:hypothetical protein [Brooklawnia cerclae]NIH57268.1 hypothetical protein [Brooklawnia cerclae]
MKKFVLTINGTAPLLHHNSRLADKLDPITRAKAVVSGKRKKTDEDDLELSRLEWLGGLYFDSEVGPYLPGDNVFKALVEAARKSKQGKQVEQGLFVTTDVNPLAYHGPRDTDSLWADENFVFRRTVKQQMSRITRTRPIFREWATEVEGAYDPAILDLRDVAAFAETAGAYIGVGDWRPRYGRFVATVREA